MRISFELQNVNKEEFVYKRDFRANKTFGDFRVNNEDYSTIPTDYWVCNVYVLILYILSFQVPYVHIGADFLVYTNTQNIAWRIFSEKDASEVIHSRIVLASVTLLARVATSLYIPERKKLKSVHFIFQ
jgi:hypothetical protein